MRGLRAAWARRQTSGSLNGGVAIELKAQHRRLRASPYVVLAVVSLLLAVVIPGPMILLGLALGTVGGLVGGLGRTKATRFRGTQLFVSGLALLVGPAAFLVASNL
jgi:hypothetical protein